ncbi:nucleotidyltransferase [Ornithinimicrobium murale]|uniref:nucleotidyltransferase n=1 Tax=Ornithinimicrobium murale TaxID=1050153 RepID=UPI001EE13330|nr:nucleotidyltransferase [Ornithinimicrobium murale]
MSTVPPPVRPPAQGVGGSGGWGGGEHIRALLEALKTVAVALKEQSVPFALAGGYAVYARGGPDSRHDVDFVITEEDAPRVLQGFTRRGLNVLEPPEDWLFKVDHGGVQVDLIYRLAHHPVDADLLERAEELSVDSVHMPVLSATDLLQSKLWALGEHKCDLAPVLTIVRSLREQIDVDLVTRGSTGHAYAEAALFLARSLDLLPAASTDSGAVTRAQELGQDG